MDKNKLTVLICDDSLLVRKKLKDYLIEKGDYNLLEAADGRSAVDIFRQHKPDIVFLDIVMPDLNGIEALKEMKAMKEDSRIIILSSSGTRSHLKSAMEAGAADFIQKPWNKSQIDHIMAHMG